MLSSSTFGTGENFIESVCTKGTESSYPFSGNICKSATHDAGDPYSGRPRALKANSKEYAGHKLKAKDEEEPAKPKGRVLGGKGV